MNVKDTSQHHEALEPVPAIGPKDFPRIMTDDPFWGMMTTAIASQSTKIVEDRLREKRNFTLAASGLVVGALSAVGLALANYLIDTRVDAKFDALNEEFQAELDQQTRDFALANDLAVLLTLAQVDSASGEGLVEVDDVVRRTRALVEELNSEDQDGQDDQLLRLYQGMLPVSLTLAQRGRTDILAEFWEIDPALLSSTDRAVALVATAFGREVISAAGGKDGWVQSDGQPTTAFDIYSDVIHQTKHRSFPEIYLQFEILRHFMIDETSPVIPDLIAEIADLSEGDLGGFVTAMAEFANQSWRTEENAETARVAETTIAFLQRYGPMSDNLSLIAQVASVPIAPQ